MLTHSQLVHTDGLRYMDIHVYIKITKTILINTRMDTVIRAGITLMLLVANLNWPIQNDAKTCKMIETLAHGYSSEYSARVFFNEYQHDRV